VEGDGFDGRAGEAAGDVGEAGAFGADVDGHCGEGVDEGEGGGAAVDGGCGGGGDVFDVGGELDDQDLLADRLSDFYHKLAESGRGRSECQAVFDVGAGDVELDAGDAVEGGDGSAGFNIIIGGVPGDVGDNGAGHFADLGYFFVEEPLQADVGQANGVEHSGPGFNDPRGGIALALLEGDGFGDESAELGEVEKIGVLKGIPAGAGAGERGVLEEETAEIGGEVDVGNEGCGGH